MKRVPVKGIDSFVGEFANAELNLSFDYGMWSDPLTGSYGTLLQRESVQIDGRPALLVVWRLKEPSPSPILSANHVPESTHTAKLTVSAGCREEASVAALRRIFESIRFRDK
jgi:hypothetical protein